MRCNTLLKFTLASGPWLLIIKLSKNSKKFFQKSGQTVIASYNALQHVTNDYNGFKTNTNNNAKIFILLLI